MDSKKLTSKEMRHFKQFVADSTKYMGEDEALTEHDFEHYNRTELSLRENDERYNSFRERFKEMILVDSSYNSFAKKYKDIYDEAVSERSALKAQASASGIAKVFSDITGSKKKAAQARLDRIEAKQRMLKEARDEEKKQYRISTYPSINVSEYTRESQKIRAKYAEIKAEAERIEQIPKASRTEEQDDFYDKYTRYPNPSLYGMTELINLLKESSRAAKTVTDQLYSDKEVGKKLPKDRIFRDVIRLCSKAGDEASCTKEKLISKSCSLYIVRYNGVNTNGVKVSEEEHRAAIDDLFESFSMHYTDLKSRIEGKPELFGGNPNPVLVIKNISFINDIFKVAQPLDEVAKVMLRSKSMGKMTEQEKAKLREWYMFFEVVHWYSSYLHSFYKSWMECIEKGITDPDSAPDTIEPFSEWLSSSTPNLD